jgi:hypothetical protein
MNKTFIFFTGAVTICASLFYSSFHAQTPSATATPAPLNQEIAALKAEIETIKGKLPDQAHAMKDVGYHFTNLWFAAQKENWPLAKFYLAETRAHLKWAVRIIPERKTSQGNLDLRPMLEGLDKTSFAAVEKPLNDRDHAGFTQAYTAAATACNSCHIASEKPFLKIIIPEKPEVEIIDFNPEKSQ